MFVVRSERYWTWYSVLDVEGQHNSTCDTRMDSTFVSGFVGLLQPAGLHLPLELLPPRRRVLHDACSHQGAAGQFEPSLRMAFPCLYRYSPRVPRDSLPQTRCKRGWSLAIFC
jgi:hypothetical protein